MVPFLYTLPTWDIPPDSSVDEWRRLNLQRDLNDEKPSDPCSPQAKSNAWANDTTNTWHAYRLFFSKQVTAFLLGFDVSQEFRGRKQMVHPKYKCSKQHATCSRTGQKLSLTQNGFLCCLLSLIFPFPSMLAATLRAHATGSAWARGNGLLAIQDWWQEGFCFRLSSWGIYELTVVISPFSLPRPYYWCLMWWPDWVTWWRRTSTHHTPTSGLAQFCGFLPHCTNGYLT